MLTEVELAALDDLTSFANKLNEIIGDDEDASYHDRNELIGHIHVLQQAIMAQSAARAHPEKFRLLGEASRRGVQNE